VSHLAIFDARSLYDRAWHASRNRDDLEEVGSTHAANGLAASMLANVLVSISPRPTDIAVAWDGRESKTKKPRGPKPPGFHEDKDKFREWWGLACGGTHATAPAGQEADDVCASWSRQYRDRYDHVTVVSADKDMHQVVDQKVNIYDVRQRCWIKQDAVLKRWNVDKPSHVALALALIGDKGDGIAGVPGIGPIKATRILEKYKRRHITDIYDSLSCEYGATFVESFGYVFLNRDLELPAPAPIAIKTVHGYLSPDGELAWRRLETRWLEPDLAEYAAVGMEEEG
jgi:DNA polymerase-1